MQEDDRSATPDAPAKPFPEHDPLTARVRLSEDELRLAFDKLLDLLPFSDQADERR